MPWWLRRMLLDPDPPAGGGGSAGATGDDNAGAGTETKKGDGEGAGDDTKKGGDKPKTVPLSEHVKLREKLRSAERERDELKKGNQAKADENLSDTDKLRKKIEDLEKKDLEREAQSSKGKLLRTAIKDLPDGMHIPEKAREKIEAQIEKMPLDDETEERIRDLVELAQRPVEKPAGGKMPKGTPNKDTSTVGQKDPKDYTGKELGELSKENPDEFKRVMSLRKQAAQRAFGPGAGAQTQKK